MLMKQHSYAFYNGHLSGVLKRRNFLQRKVQQIRSLQVRTHSNPEDMDGHSRHHKRPEPANPAGLGSISSSGLAKVLNMDAEEMDTQQLEDFETALVAEIDSCSIELTSRVSGGTLVQYPDNLTWWNYLEYIHFPT